MCNSNSSLGFPKCLMSLAVRLVLNVAEGLGVFGLVCKFSLAGVFVSVANSLLISVEVWKASLFPLFT